MVISRGGGSEPHAKTGDVNAIASIVYQAITDDKGVWQSIATQTGVHCSQHRLWECEHGPSLRLATWISLA